MSLSKKVSWSLPAGGLISGGGIMGTMMGRLPCSLVLGVEVDAVVEGSVTPFLEAGKGWELLARSGEPSPLSVEGGIFGNKFSRQGKLSKIKRYRTADEMLWQIFPYTYMPQRQRVTFYRTRGTSDCLTKATMKVKAVHINILILTVDQINKCNVKGAPAL